MRTIDADAMKSEVKSLDAESNNRIYQCAMEDMLEFFIELIDKQPTIEPKRGEWLSYTGTHYTGKENEYGDPEYKEHIFFVCSKCRRKTVVRENFCPNCGADMREVSEDAGTD